MQYNTNLFLRRGLSVLIIYVFLAILIQVLTQTGGDLSDQTTRFLVFGGLAWVALIAAGYLAIVGIITYRWVFSLWGYLVGTQVARRVTQKKTPAPVKASVDMFDNIKPVADNRPPPKIKGVRLESPTKWDPSKIRQKVI